VGKNITELQATIDSVTERIDSVGAIYAKDIKETTYMRVPYYKETNTYGERVVEKQKPVAMKKPINVDSIFYKARPEMVASYLTQAMLKATRVKQDYEFRSFQMDDDRRTVRRHGIELHKKFTLSFACLIFFFIGAPLGAIIRKGGIGTPLVVSVLLFIFYYIIDNVGYNLAKKGRVEVWEGVWLSSAVLLPLGVFFTTKAMKDSAVFDLDAYKNLYRRLTGKIHRELEVKEFSMQEVETPRALELLNALRDLEAQLQKAYRSMNSFKRAYYLIRKFPLRDATQTALNNTVDYLADSRDAHVINALNKLPFQLTVRNVDEALSATTELINLFEN
jgi:lipopolysaccharide export system permease protein